MEDMVEHLIVSLINTDYRLGDSSKQELGETHLVVLTTVTSPTEAPHIIEEMGTIGDLLDLPTLEIHPHLEILPVGEVMTVLALGDLHLVVDVSERDLGRDSCYDQDRRNSM